MAPANNFRRSSIPSLAAIEHRRRQLLAWRAAQRASPAEPLDDPPGGDNPYPEEDAQLAEGQAPEAPETKWSSRSTTLWAPAGGAKDAARGN